ncbi:MAG TPA: PilN domain-containing protein [Azospirillum sp.]|nr:PilN domain-containing protein [Azospirillum sp.]
MMDASPARALLNRLATWWLAEAATWLPPSWRRGAALAVARWDGTRIVLPGRTPRRGQSVTLRLGAQARALTRRVTLPEAASGHLRAVAAHQLDRWTPWPAEQAWFAVRPLGPAAGEPGMLAVEVTALPRAAAAPALDALAALGLRPAAVELDDGTRLPAADDGGDDDARARRLRRAVLALPFLAAAALVGREWLDLKRVEAEVEELRVPAGAVRRLADAVAMRETTLAFADARKEQWPSATVVLEVLSRLLPDDTSLTEFHLDEGAVLLLGRSSDAARLPGLLAASPHFTEVRASAAMVRSPDGTDQFQLSARVVPHAAP